MGEKLLVKALEIQSKEIALEDSNSSKVVNICDFGNRRREQVERWLEEQINRKYGERGSHILKNPLIRINIMFDNLSYEAQNELLGYAKWRILRIDCDLTLRDKFRSVMDKGGIQDGSWEDIEEYADNLLIHEKIYKRAWK